MSVAMASPEAALSRPALRWHGGKWVLAPWIIRHFAPHRVYVEPFGGAASILLRKEPAYAEIYNDVDDGVVNLFRVLRQPETAEQLMCALRLTPFARAEWEASYEVSAEPVEEARRLVVRSYMGFASTGSNRAVKTGFRGCSSRDGGTAAHDWANYPDACQAIADRMRGVIIENRAGIDIMRQHDGADTLHYVDPPYLPEVRSAKARRGGERYHVYAHELTVEDHEQLLAALKQLRGMVVLSGYPAPRYDRALSDWLRIERPAMADGARPRVEVLWINPAGAEALRRANSTPLLDLMESRSEAMCQGVLARAGT
jgi:DNA adenine methylase